jgi:glycosyltransferase involved in cell wall biosynthesis
VEDLRTSVLMSVYHRVDAGHFNLALASIFDQTRLPDEIVVVEDGPLTPELDGVLEAYSRSDIPLLRVPLPENRGLAAALQRGLSATRHPWIVRMDADDVALPHRIEAQMGAVARGDVDVVGAAMIEFNGQLDNHVGIRSLPLHHADIAKYARINNPINHPTAVIRRTALDAVGGYRSVHLMEDYDLFARLLTRGFRFRNLADPVLLFRSGDSMFRRRVGRGMFRAERQLQRNLVDYGLVNRRRAALNLVLRSAFRALPQSALRRAYRTLFYR